MQTKITTFALALAVGSLAGCGSTAVSSAADTVSAQDAADTTAAGDSTKADAAAGDAEQADVAADTAKTAKLQEGGYIGTVKAILKNGCGEGLEVGAGNPDLRWLGDSKFTLTYMGPKVVYQCTVGSPSTCEQVDIAMEVSPTLNQVLKVTTHSVVPVSATEFVLHQTMQVGCSGAACPNDPPCSVEAELTNKVGGCDVLLNNCSDPNAGKCTLSLDAKTNVVTAECKPALGKAKLNEPCTRPNGVVGEDTCDVSLYCSYFGLPKSNPQQRVCRQVCEFGSACPDGTICFALGDGTVAGHCAPSCTPFENKCGSPELTCKMMPTVSMGQQFNFTCGWSGTVADYAPCTDAFDCGPNTNCRADSSGKPKCAPLCDTAHPCADQEATCTPFASWAVSDFGSCLK